MVKDHSYSEKGNPLPPHRLLLSINSKGSFICTRITHTAAFVTPVVEHWLEREIAQWVHPMKDRSDDPSHHERTLYLWATSRSPIPNRVIFMELQKYIYMLDNDICIICVYFSFQPVIHDWCNKGRGMYHPVCGMMHIKKKLAANRKE